VDSTNEKKNGKTELEKELGQYRERIRRKTISGRIGKAFSLKRQLAVDAIVNKYGASCGMKIDRKYTDKSRPSGALPITNA
jgi:hypothetical protein